MQRQAVNSTNQEPVFKDDIEVCQACGNVYVVIWVVESERYNDFGLRHCPFCGLLCDETGSVVP